ncbi:MAG: UDP-N-acetylmuramoyl-L-alanine--D-glutamate ligase [Acidimicrobiales bacterium]
MSRVLVFGFGVTGRAATAVLAAGGDKVTVVDDRTDETIASNTITGETITSRTITLKTMAEEVARLGGELQPAGRLAEVLESVDLVMASPGVAVHHPLFSLAQQAGVEVVSEVELAARALAARPAPAPKLLAITGTNGKTTVTSLVAHILGRSGRTAVMAGNIGSPLIEAVGTAADVVVLEVSSFQLQLTSSLHPDVSAWLNLAPDHLDWHPTMGHYAQAKARIWANQGSGDIVVVNADDDVVMAAAATLPAGVRRWCFGTRHTSEFTVRRGWLVGPGDQRLVEVADLPRALPHDVANALAAAALALAAGASPDAVAAGLASAPALPHRVAEVAAAGGVTWYDDSKATTPASVLAAVAGFASVVLIAGGRNKGLDLSVLAETVPPVRAAVAIGEAAPDVERALGGRVPVRAESTMTAAVDAAAELARPGDAVLLSPGCASFDWYPDYAARGDHFARLVKQHIEKGNPPW